MEKDFEKTIYEFARLFENMTEDLTRVNCKAREIADKFNSHGYSKEEHFEEISDEIVRLHNLTCRLGFASYLVKEKSKDIMFDYYGMKREHYDYGSWVKSDKETSNETV